MTELIDSFVRCEALPDKFIFLRHDLDSDVATMMKMIKIEQALEIKSTTFFRLSTLDTKTINLVKSVGSEIGYHYEELSDYCLRNGIVSKLTAKDALPLVRKIFIENLKYIKNMYSISICSFAAHGDFINRKIDVPNTEVLDDVEFRNTNDIFLEAYDRKLIDIFDIYITDKCLPVEFSPINIQQAINCYDKIYFVTHPRQWNTSLSCNVNEYIIRIFHSLLWKFNKIFSKKY